MTSLLFLWTLKCNLVQGHTKKFKRGLVIVWISKCDCVHGLHTEISCVTSFSLVFSYTNPQLKDNIPCSSTWTKSCSMRAGPYQAFGTVSTNFPGVTTRKAEKKGEMSAVLFCIYMFSILCIVYYHACASNISINNQYDRVCVLFLNI